SGGDGGGSALGLVGGMLLLIAKIAIPIVLLAAVAVGAAVYHLADDGGDDPAAQKCTRYLSVPPEKGGNICAD
ncbi:MAG: hypothetical protein AAFW60_01660, partial [Pseudomonadota bacterium]